MFRFLLSISAMYQENHLAVADLDPPELAETWVSDLLSLIGGYSQH